MNPFSLQICSNCLAWLSTVLGHCQIKPKDVLSLRSLYPSKRPTINTEKKSSQANIGLLLSLWIKQIRGIIWEGWIWFKREYSEMAFWKRSFWEVLLRSWAKIWIVKKQSYWRKARGSQALKRGSLGKERRNKWKRQDFNEKKKKMRSVFTVWFLWIMIIIFSFSISK